MILLILILFFFSCTENLPKKPFHISDRINQKNTEYRSESDYKKELEDFLKSSKLDKAQKNTILDFNQNLRIFWGDNYIDLFKKVFQKLKLKEKNPEHIKDILKFLTFKLSNFDEIFKLENDLDWILDKNIIKKINYVISSRIFEKKHSDLGKKIWEKIAQNDVFIDSKIQDDPITIQKLTNSKPIIEKLISKYSNLTLDCTIIKKIFELQNVYKTETSTEIQQKIEDLIMDKKKYGNPVFSLWKILQNQYFSQLDIDYKKKIIDIIQNSNNDNESAISDLLTSSQHYYNYKYLNQYQFAIKKINIKSSEEEINIYSKIIQSPNLSKFTEDDWKKICEYDNKIKHIDIFEVIKKIENHEKITKEDFYKTLKEIHKGNLQKEIIETIFNSTSMPPYMFFLMNPYNHDFEIQELIFNFFDKNKFTNLQIMDILYLINLQDYGKEDIKYFFDLIKNKKIHLEKLSNFEYLTTPSYVKLYEKVYKEKSKEFIENLFNNLTENQNFDQFYNKTPEDQFIYLNENGICFDFYSSLESN